MNKDLLLTLMGEERSIEERIESLNSVKDLLGNSEIVLALASLYPDERSSEVRRAILSVVLGCQNVTPAIFEFLYTVLARESEVDLRLAAVKRLAEMAAGHPMAEEILIECLKNDVSLSIQSACLRGLQNCIRRNPSSLYDYAATVPFSLKQELVALFEGDAVGLSMLLDPADPHDLKSTILDRLAGFPSMPSQTLLTYLKEEPTRELRGKALRILMERTQIDPELVLSETDHIELLNNRLDSYPELVGKLVALLKRTRSIPLKLTLLQRLDRLDLYIEAVADSNPSVRRVGVEGCLKRIHRDDKAVTRALMDAIPKEPIVSLREMMIRSFDRMNPDVERFLIDWCGRETDPRLEQALASAIVKVAVTDENRAPLLRIYLRILQEPFFDVGIRAAVLEKLTSYAHRNEPELKQALIGLLERAPNLDTVERVDRLLRLVEPDPKKLAPVRLKVFYRFVGRYPIDPLVQWLREFRSLAADIPDIRKQIAYLAAITEATWILDAAESSAKSNLVSMILDCLRKDAQRDANDLLKEAYQNRTLKKSDLISLFNTLLNFHLSPHNSYPMLDSILKIMTEVKLVTPEVLDRGFAYLKTFPHGSAEYMLRRFLEDTGPHEERLQAEFTAENYRRFCLQSLDARDSTRLPHSWGDSDHWRVWHSQWTIGEMVREKVKDWKTLVARRLLDPLDPKVPCQQSFHYYLLYQLWRSPPLSIEERAAVGRFMRTVKSVKGYEQLFDRALFVFSDRWSEARASVTPEVAELAAEAFVEQMRRRRGRLPQLLEGMNVDHLRSIWPWGDKEWDQMWSTYGDYLKGERSSSGSDREPMFYAPIENAQSSVIDFLIGTPHGSQARIWSNLLKTAGQHCGRMLDYRLEKASPERRAKLQELIGN